MTGSNSFFKSLILPFSPYASNPNSLAVLKILIALTPLFVVLVNSLKYSLETSPL